jgi:CBS-domain-containing membrane protein
VIPLTPLRIQYRETLRADGSVRKERLAFCNKTASWVPLGRCNVCSACAHLSGDAEPVLICSAAPPTSVAQEDSVRSCLAPSVWCIVEDAPARLVSNMPVTQADAIVVDGDGHAIGLLSRQAARRAHGDAIARSAMEPAIVALFDDAPIAWADELLSRRGVRTLPILSAGRVIGCIEADYRARRA